MNYVEAKKHLEQGKFLKRKSWPKSVFVYQEPDKIKTFEKLKGYDLKASLLSAKLNSHIEEKYSERLFLSHLRMKDSEGSIIVGWSPSKEDLEKEDWFIIE